MDQFLAGIERRALVMAEMATHSREDALDLVQDTMLAFVHSYRTRNPAEWPPLFHRVLQNGIRDWHRRHRSRGRWWGRLAHWQRSEEGAVDPIQDARDPSGLTPDATLMGHESMQQILQAVERLPLRQQQAFLLRIWEGLNVADTARTMACSNGSVKTHLSRALQSLRQQLQNQRP